MTAKLTPALREKIENTIRFLAVDAVERAGCGHPGAPMGLARPAFELWDHHLRFDPSDPQWPLRDRFVLSAGHASMLLYSLLHLFHYDLPMEQLESFRQLHSKTPGHPEFGETPGVEVTTGPLGQGFAHGVGMALAGMMTRSRFGSGGPGHHRVYGIVSAGDLMEGISYEAASLAGHLGLGNLTYLYDDNQVTIDGPTSLAFSEDVAKRFEAQRWHVQKVDGQDVDGLASALEAARADERPSLVITRTTIGYGSPNRAGLSKAHGEKLGEEEVRLTKEALGWPQEPTFLVPDEVAAYFAERSEEKRAERAAVDERIAAWRKAEPERASAWDAVREKRLPEGLGAQIAESLEGKADATRKHSGAVLQQLAGAAPWLVGGSADLTPSNNTEVKGVQPVGPGAGADGDAFGGRYLHCGIREHAMAGVTDGIALDGTFRPYAGTFLIFSDYMRPGIRLAALMGAPSIFVFTHDSIFLGEDGPTHQPIEQLDALRAIPNLTVFRPADGVETAMAWAWALQRAEGPALLALTRQTLPALQRRAQFEPTEVWRGAYVVRDVDASPDVVLLATGSEVSLAADTAAKLHADGVSARVVSAPSLDRFAVQDEAWREAVLPREVPVVAVEAGRGGSLWPFLGSRGLVYGIDRFGASAPLKELAEAYGFTPDALAARVLQHLGR
jgi:transketolase